VAQGYTIKRAAEFESLHGSGDVTWRLCRRSLGVESFGINLIEIPAGSSIVEHDETESGQEEVYAVLEGEGTLLLDGEEHRAPAGTWARISPEVKRNLLNRSEAPLTALLVGVPRGTGYSPPGWA
jgi:uncharacterized cupin superfamily protein